MSDQFLPRALSIELRLQQPGLDIRAQFRVLPARVCALLGHSGSGKTALLKAAAGLLPALGGQVALGSDALYDSNAGINLPPHARRLTWLDAHGHLLPHLNVRRNLLYGHQGVPQRRPGLALDDIVKWLDLGTLLQHKPHQLDASERLRVALGRALLSAPNALFMVDPLADVPELARSALLDTLAEVPVRFRLPVILITPRMDEVIRLAHEVAILHEGRMASVGATAQILSNVSLATFLEGTQAGSLLEGEVKQHDIEWLLSEIDVCGQRLTVPATLHPVGSKVRVKIRARDVSLHRELQTDTSTSNQLRGRVSQIMLAGDHGTYGAVSVELDSTLDFTGPMLHIPPKVEIWAMLTRKAIQQMNWAPGHPCVVGIKAMATSVSTWH